MDFTPIEFRGAPLRPSRPLYLRGLSARAAQPAPGTSSISQSNSQWNLTASVNAAPFVPSRPRLAPKSAVSTPMDTSQDDKYPFEEHQEQLLKYMLDDILGE
jgi:hypothetical protein